ncbi:hypothetical protein [Streptomyces nojiriensis]|nr:hypothetical protein [Streptomyces nojiriensis]QTI42260.1 hypothetical protein JYK04_00017 [Streptomyces nojiriensis]GGS39879.1 hypothetical protein GCM10010205_81890 [Streptomyces nojiriensis]
MQGLSRRVVAAVGWVPLAAVFVLGCGADPAGNDAPRGNASSHDAGAKASSSPLPSPLTGAQTVAAVLAPVDLRGDWKTTSEDLSPHVEERDHGIIGVDGDAACDEVVAGSFRDAKPTAVASRTMRDSNRQTVVGVSVDAYPSVEGARQKLETVRQLRQKCSGAAVESYTIEYGVLSTPPRGDESYGVRMRANGQRFDEIVIRVGASTVSVTFAESAGDDTELVDATTAQAAEKLRQAALR